MPSCSKCLVEKPLSEFYKKQPSRGGHDSCCKACKLAYAAAYREANREALCKKQKVYDAENKVRLDVYRAEYRVRNKSKIQEKKKRDYLRDPQKIIDRSIEWSKANPEIHKSYFHNTRAKKKGIQGRLSRDIITTLLVTQSGNCAACNLPLTVPYHVDHIVALSNGGLNIDSNIQLLHPLCNARKGVLPNEEFLKQLNRKPA